MTILQPRSPAEARAYGAILSRAQAKHARKHNQARTLDLRKSMPLRDENRRKHKKLSPMQKVGAGIIAGHVVFGLAWTIYKALK
jgi:hypothetical protein